MKITVRNHFTTVRMATTKRQQIKSADEDVEKRAFYYSVGGNVN